MSDRRHVTATLALVLGLMAASTSAQLRTLPDEARRGYLQHVQELLVTIDGAQAWLAPGATIRDRNNFIVVPASLPREGAWVDYQMDANGQISRAWLLTPRELAQPRKPQR